MSVPGAGWWRRNAVALVALAVLVPASWLALDTIEFGTTRNPQQAVDAGTSTTVDGARFGPARLHPLDDDGLDVPAGAQPVLVTVPVAHPVETTSCQGATTTEVATGRTWRAASLVLGWTPGAGQQETCRSETGAAVDFAAPFLLNVDASGPFVVTMSVMRDGTVVDLRFDVDLTGG